MTTYLTRLRIITKFEEPIVELCGSKISGPGLRFCSIFLSENGGENYLVREIKGWEG